jgi:hypothetical protein
MKGLNPIMQQIVELTTRIETEYPELYHFLDETPITISKTPTKEVTVEDLKNYLQTLHSQLEEHIRTHKKKLGRDKS